MAAKHLASARCPGKIRVQDVRPFLFQNGECGRALNFSGTVDKNVNLAKRWQ